MAQSHDSVSLLDTNLLVNMQDFSVAIVATEWNETIVKEQIAGAKRIAEKAGLGSLKEVIVPGCFELPYACKCLWDNKESFSEIPDAIIAFGAVIRGGTPHFEYVCKAVTEGILQLNLTLPIPTIFGVLTLDTEAQAWERLGGSHGHKGEEAMITALKMIKMKIGL
jgi:6,7-dimethyl-8-ribityllumazine synthase